MAFNKRTWLGRQGTGLNKFSIGGATPVTIVNQPDSVTQVGDALSAGNLNDLEDRIEDAFDDVDTALDTKANEQDVTNLNNALTAIDHRVQNLEQAKGDYVVQSYKDGSITPSGKGKWCVVEGVEGVSRVENQLVQDHDFSVASGWSVFQCSVASGGVITTTGTSVNKSIYRNIASTSGHVMLAVCSVTASRASTCRLNVCGSYSESVSVPANKKTLLIYLGTPNYNNSNVTLYFDIGGDMQVGDTCTVDFLCASDLSVYFAGDPSVNVSSLTIADIQRDYPHLLLPSDYGTRLIDWTGNGVRAEGVNIWDEQTELGVISSSTGEKADSLINIRTVNYIPVLPSAEYYAKTPYLLNLRYYDVNKNFIGVGTAPALNGSFTTPSGCRFLMFFVMSDYGVTYKHDIQISEVHGSVSTVNTTYHPYMENTLSFPSTSLKSAGSVREKKLLNVEVEIDGQKVQKSVKTNPLGSYAFTGQEAWTWYDGASLFFSNNLIDVGKEGYLAGQTLCSNGIVVKVDNRNLVVYLSDNPQLSSSTNMNNALPNGTVLYYEQSTPNPDTYSDPIIDNTLLTEAYGRLSTVQTGTVVDGIADLGFITL